MKTTKRLDIYPASGGLDGNRNVGQIDPRRLVEANNIVFDTATTARKKRPGIGQFYASGITSFNNPMGIYDYFRTVAGSPQHRLVTFIDGRVYAGDGNGIFTDITGAATLSATDTIVYDVFIGLLIMAFKNNYPHYWTQSGNIVNMDPAAGFSVDTPKASLYRTHLNHGWMAGVHNYPHRIYKSDTGNPLIWTPGGPGGAEYFDVNAGDGDPVGITALFPSFHNDLIVAKRKSLYRIYWNGTAFGVAELVKGIGCIAPNTVVPIHNDIIFCSERGVHSLSTTDSYGDYQTSFLSSNIHKTYIEELDFTRADEMSAVYSSELNSYLLVFPRVGFGLSTDILGYNIINKEWYRWENVNAAFIANYIDTRNRDREIVLSKNGNIGLLNSEVLTDYDEPYTVLCKTGIIYPYNIPKQQVNFKSITIYYVPKGNYTFNLTYKIDNLEIETLIFDQSGLGGTPLGEFTLGIDQLGFSGKIKTVTKPLQGTGSGIELTFYHIPETLESYDEDVEILGYSIEFIDAGDTSETITS